MMNNMHTVASRKSPDIVQKYKRFHLFVNEEERQKSKNSCKLLQSYPVYKF